MLKEILYILFKGIYQVQKGSYTNSSYYRSLKNLGLFEFSKSKIIQKMKFYPVGQIMLVFLQKYCMM